jgi:thiol-disulfide isomerase/thioredoxin
MYPHERSLVARLADKPFVLIGVNSDPDRKQLAPILVKEKITWRSFWNGGSTNGPISAAWGIRGWPSLFLIDHKGVIRHAYNINGSPGPAVLDKAIDDLVRQAQTVTRAPELDRDWLHALSGEHRGLPELRAPESGLTRVSAHFSSNPAKPAWSGAAPDEPVPPQQGTSPNNRVPRKDIAPPKESPKSGIDLGMTAPDIDEVDVHGERLQLSDSRGKVVLLNFWGNWCPSCRAMYPQQRALAARLADQPFVLIGVNSDRDRKALAPVLVQEKITWRSFWNGGSTNGPISAAWGIKGWPSLFLIDHKGVIKQKWVGSPPPDVLDKAIDELVNRAQADTRAPGLDRDWLRAGDSREFQLTRFLAD